MGDKRLFLIFFLSFLDVHTILAQVWTPKSKLGESNISDIRFQDKDTGYILSFSKVFRTTDAGETWSRILNSYSRFTKCYFADAKNGWIIGGNNLVLRTTNGGVSWSLSRTAHSAIDPYTIYAKDKDTLYMLATEDLDTYKYGMFFYRTYDGGSNWSRVSTGSTQTMRGLYQWTKDRGIIGTLTSGVFRTQNGWSSYATNTARTQIRGLSVIRDSIVVVVGNNGAIARSTDYGANFSTITSPVTTHLSGLHFVNDTLGMASGDNGVMLITKDGGQNWSKMVTQSTLNFQAIHVISPLYAWAIVNVPHADSFQVFRYGDKSLFSNKINFIEGAVLADVNKNCKNDNGEKGPSGILIKASPGPYFTYTTSGGSFSLPIPDTGRFKVEALLPDKYIFGNGLCDTAINGIYFNTFEQWATGQNFMYDSDTSFKLQIKVSSSRKRRCAWNNNLITYRNLGTRSADSTVIRISYPSNLITLQKHALEKERGEGYIVLKTGSLNPDEEKSIDLLDSVLCRSGVMGLTVCLRVQITPEKIVQKTYWDSSWIQTRIDCLNDSTAIVKFFNTGKPMGDSAGLTVYLDEDRAGEIKYKIGEQDSFRFEVLRKNHTLTVVGDIDKHHPYYEQMRLWRERCGEETRNTEHSVVTRFELEKFPPFEDEFCLPIRDSYDPNDITVTPNGRTEEHFVKKDGRLNYHIRFQNTGNDTAYHVYIIDTLPDEVDPRSIEFKGSSHKYEVKFASSGGKNILRFDFNNIYLVDSATNEPGSNGWVNFDINMIKGLKHRRKISNFVDIYFDFNDPVRTNTAWIQIYDTIIQPNGKGVIVDCKSQFIKKAQDTLICNQNRFDFTITSEGKNKGNIRLIDSLASLSTSQDSLFYLSAGNEGIFRLESSIWDCDVHKIDTVIVHFMNAPQLQLKDSIHCDDVNQELAVSCYSCSYTWNNDSTQSKIWIKQQGTYTVSMENLCGVITDTSRIQLIPYVQIELGTDTLLCDVASYELKNRKHAIPLRWHDSSNAMSFAADTDGWYFATYNDLCNQLQDSIFLRFRKQPVLYLGNDTLLCDQDTLRLELPNHDGEYSFLWENNDMNSVRILSESGIFAATASNLCGDRSDTIVINKLHTPSQILRDTAYCGNEGILLSYVQKNNEEVLRWQDSALEGSRKFFRPGIYHARLENLCGSTPQQLEIMKYDIPSAVFTIDNPCRTDSVITANFSSSVASDQLFYSWYLNGVFMSSALQPSFYYTDSTVADVKLIVQSDKGCSDSSIQAFNKKHRVSAGFNFSGYCLGDSTHFINQSLATNDDVQYLWTFGDGNSSTEATPTHIYLGQAGTYLVVLKASFEGGCRDSTVLPVNIENKPSAAFVHKVRGKNILLNIPSPEQNISYRWSIGAMIFYDSLTWHFPIPESRFSDSICLSAEDPVTGCYQTECEWIEIDMAATGMPFVAQLGIYPNPGYDILNLVIPGTGVFDINIHSSGGQLITKLKSSDSHVEIEVSHWTSGVYFVEVVGEQGERYRASFVKIH